VSDTGREATVRATHVPVLDQFQFLGPSLVPATVSFEVHWQAIGPTRSLGSGKTVPPTDPAAFLGQFARARAVGSFSGTELGFRFHSEPGVSSDRGYAELGHERNGVFL
jgi:hypothetical protein